MAGNFKIPSYLSSCIHSTPVTLSWQAHVSYRITDLFEWYHLTFLTLACLSMITGCYKSVCANRAVRQTLPNITFGECAHAYSSNFTIESKFKLHMNPYEALQTVLRACLLIISLLRFSRAGRRHIVSVQNNSQEIETGYRRTGHYLPPDDSLHNPNSSQWSQLATC